MRFIFSAFLLTLCSSAYADRLICETSEPFKITVVVQDVNQDNVSIQVFVNDQDLFYSTSEDTTVVYNGRFVDLSALLFHEKKGRLGLLDLRVHRNTENLWKARLDLVATNLENPVSKKIPCQYQN